MIIEINKLLLNELTIMFILLEIFQILYKIIYNLKYLFKIYNFKIL